MNRWSTGVWVGLLVLALVTTFSSVGLADSSTVADANDSGSGYPDIKEASHGHTPSGKLKHTIRTYNTFRTSDAPCLDMRVGRQPYQLCGDGTVFTIGVIGGDSEATVRRPNDRTVVYIFSKRSIGASNAYKWRAESVYQSNCTGDDCDSAPNDGEPMIRHEL